MTDNIDFDTLPHWWRRTRTRQASPNGSRRRLATTNKAQTADQGHRITLSWVSFNDDERLIGDSAKNACHSDPENTVFDAECHEGRNFKSAHGKPIIEVKHKGERATSLPEKSALWSVRR